MDWNNFNTGQNPHMFNHNQEYSNEHGSFNQNEYPQYENPNGNIQTDQVPSSKKDCYYDILQICKTADTQEIKKAYRKQSLIWHPDKNAERKEEAEERFKLISEAFQILSDDQKRRAYDNHGLSPVPVQSDDEYDYDFSHGYPDPFGPAAVFASPFELFDQMFAGFSFDQGPLFPSAFSSRNAFFGGFPHMAPFNMSAFSSPFGMLNHPLSAPFFPFHNPHFPTAQNRGPVMSHSAVSSNNFEGETVIKTTTFINGRSATIIETNDSKVLPSFL